MTLTSSAALSILYCFSFFLQTIKFCIAALMTTTTMMMMMMEIKSSADSRTASVAVATTTSHFYCAPYASIVASRI